MIAQQAIIANIIDNADGRTRSVDFVVNHDFLKSIDTTMNDHFQEYSTALKLSEVIYTQLCEQYKNGFQDPNDARNAEQFFERLKQVMNNPAGLDGEVGPAVLSLLVHFKTFAMLVDTADVYRANMITFYYKNVRNGVETISPFRLHRKIDPQMHRILHHYYKLNEDNATNLS